MTAKTYREIHECIPKGFGVLLAVPKTGDVSIEMKYPGEPDEKRQWKLVNIVPVEIRERKGSGTKLMVAMRKAEREARAEMLPASVNNP